MVTMDKKEADLILKKEEKLNELTSSEISNLNLKKEFYQKIKTIMNDNSLDKTKLLIIQDESAIIEDNNLKNLKILNKKILLPLILKLITNIKSLDLKNIRLEQIEIEEDKKADKILSGLNHVLPQNISNDIEIKNYLNTGLKGLQIIEKKLEQREIFNKEEIKKLSYMLSEFHSIKKNIEEQLKLIEKLLNYKKNIIYRLKLIKFDPKNETMNLKALIGKEIAEDYNSIRIISEFKVLEEYDEVSKINLFEKEEIEMTKNLKLLLNQFNIPKLDFPSGNFVTYRTSIQESLKILKDNALSPFTIQDKSHAIANGIRMQVNYSVSDINKVNENSNGEIIFLSPIENIMSSLCFNLEGRSIKMYMYSDEKKKEDFEIKSEKFQLLQKNMNDHLKEWIEEAKKLDNNFVNSWSEQSEILIKKQFTKRWITDSFPDFYARYGLDFITIIVLMKNFESRTIEHKTTSISRESIIDDISKLSMEELTKEIEKANQFCADSMKDLKGFMEKTHLPLERCICLLPKQHVLYFEKYFLTLPTRPNAFYYSSQPLKAAEYTLSRCRKNNSFSEMPGTRCIRIFDEKTNMSLENM